MVTRDSFQHPSYAPFWAIFEQLFESGIFVDVLAALFNSLLTKCAPWAPPRGARQAIGRELEIQVSGS